MNVFSGRRRRVLRKRPSILSYPLLITELTPIIRFGLFFNHIDHFPVGHFLYVTSGGIEAAELQQEVASGPGKSTASKKQKQEYTDKSQHDVLAAVEGESDGEGAQNDGDEGN